MNEGLDQVYIEGLGTRVIVYEKILQFNDLNWKTNDGHPYLTLKEISDQITSKHGECLIYVWTESGLSGTIYMYGNNGPYWVKHGTTRGYA